MDFEAYALEHTSQKQETKLSKGEAVIGYCPSVPFDPTCICRRHTSILQAPLFPGNLNSTERLQGLQYFLASASSPLNDNHS